jgi:hypothetical protein
VITTISIDRTSKVPYHTHILTNTEKHKMSFKPTQEQEACKVSYDTRQSFKVEAVAGSGKTSTVKLMAESDASRSALYLAFNKAAATEASEKMPFHVTCRTTHSMAYAAFGATYRKKLSRPHGGYVNVAGTVSEIVKFFKVKNTGSLNRNAIARLAKLTVASFESSSASKISERNIPYSEVEILARKADLKGDIFERQSVNKSIMSLASKLWEARIDLGSPVLITHDTYLKMYQLSKPTLDYDVVFLDEAQDTSDCVIDIVMGQAEHTQIVCVGDSFQAIYGWRGAVNALGKIKSQSTPLSQSFRYGPEVANVATAILDGAMVVKGFDKIPTKVGVVDREQPYTMLFRTNAALIEEGESLINQGVNVNIDIDTRGYVRKMEAMAMLYNGEATWKIKHEDICIFEDWNELMEEAELVKGELARIAKKVVSGEYRKTLAIFKKYTKPLDASVMLTTAHKSKGMEYDQVILANDFPSVINEEGDYTELNDMERNLVYVASTRPRVCLELNKTVEDIIAQRIESEQDLNAPIDSLPDQEIGVLFEKVMGRETSSDMAMLTNDLLQAK